jgi:Flp pilus assembly protein TadD
MNYYLGDLQAAIENHSNAVALQPNDHLARSNLGDSLWVAGREEEARLTFEKAESLVQEALRVNPNDPFSMMDLAWIEAMLGNHDDARSLMGRVRTRLPDDPYTYYYDALVWLRAGDKSAALDALETAVEKGYSRQLLSAEPHLDALRGENRFMSIVAGS